MNPTYCMTLVLLLSNATFTRINIMYMNYNTSENNGGSENKIKLRTGEKIFRLN